MLPPKRQIQVKNCKRTVMTKVMCKKGLALHKLLGAERKMAVIIIPIIIIFIIIITASSSMLSMKPSELSNDGGSLIIWHKPKYCGTGASLGSAAAAGGEAVWGSCVSALFPVFLPHQPSPRRVRQRADTFPRRPTGPPASISPGRRSSPALCPLRPLGCSCCGFGRGNRRRLNCPAGGAAAPHCATGRSQSRSGSL